MLFGKGNRGSKPKEGSRAEEKKETRAFERKEDRGMGRKGPKRGRKL